MSLEYNLANRILIANQINIYNGSPWNKEGKVFTHDNIDEIVEKSGVQETYDLIEEESWNNFKTVINEKRFIELESTDIFTNLRKSIRGLDYVCFVGDIQNFTDIFEDFDSKRIEYFLQDYNCTLSDNVPLFLLDYKKNALTADDVNKLFSLSDELKEDNLYSFIKVTDDGATVLPFENDIKKIETLFNAAKNKELDKVKQLLNDGVSINTVHALEIVHETILMIAVENQYIEMVQFLLEQGANTQSPSEYKNSPFLLAVKSGNVELVQLFVERDIGKDEQMDSFFENTSSYIIYAISKNYTEMVKLFLEKEWGDLKDTSLAEGDTALTIAVKNNNFELLKLLVQKGLDINVTNKNGESAYDIAKKNDYKTIIDFLLSKGAYDKDRAFDNVELFGEAKKAQHILQLVNSLEIDIACLPKRMSSYLRGLEHLVLMYKLALSDEAIRTKFLRSDKVPYELLEYIVNNIDSSQETNFLWHPSTPMEILEKLVLEVHGGFKMFLATEKHTPVVILEKLIDDVESTEFALENPNTPLSLVKKFLDSEDINHLRGIASNPNCTEEMCRKLYQIQDKDVKRLLLQNPNIPEDLLYDALEDGTYETVETITKNSNLSIDLINIIMKLEDGAFLGYIASSPSTPVSILESLMDIETECLNIKYHLADNPNTPEHTLIEMCKDSRIKEDALLNKNIPIDLLVEAFEKNPKESIKEALLKHPHTPFYIYYMHLAKDEDIKIKSEALLNSYAVVDDERVFEILEHLMSFELQVNQKDDNNKRALDYAREYRNKEIINLLEHYEQLQRLEEEGI